MLLCLPMGTCQREDLLLFLLKTVAFKLKRLLMLVYGPEKGQGSRLSLTYEQVSLQEGLYLLRDLRPGMLSFLFSRILVCPFLLLLPRCSSITLVSGSPFHSACLVGTRAEASLRSPACPS